jgi:hypothetical protein
VPPIYDPELLVVAAKFVSLVDVLSPELFDRSIMKMMGGMDEGHEALEKAGITAHDILCLKVADLLPKKARSTHGFTLHRIALPCAVFLAEHAMDRVGHVAKEIGVKI